MEREPVQFHEEATHCGVEALQQAHDTVPRNDGDITLREYTATPPGPTRLTGNVLVDYINRTLDELVFGTEGVKCQVEEAAPAGTMTEAQQTVTHTTEGGCEGNTDYLAFLRGLFLCPATERSVAPLPTAIPAGRFANFDPFTREVLGQMCKDEPETYLPYIHFHRATPAHPTYVLSEGPAQVPGWSAGPPCSSSK